MGVGLVAVDAEFVGIEWGFDAIDRGWDADCCLGACLCGCVFEIPSAVAVGCGLCGDGARGVPVLVALEDVDTFKGVGVCIERGGAEESARTVGGERDGVDRERVVTGVFMVTDEERGDLGDDELLVEELDSGETDRDDEDRLDDSVESNPGSHECDEFAVFGHLCEGESHCSDHDHAEEEVVELEELWPPQVGDQEDGED